MQGAEKISDFLCDSSRPKWTGLRRLENRGPCSEHEDASRTPLARAARWVKRTVPMDQVGQKNRPLGPALGPRHRKEFYYAAIL